MIRTLALCLLAAPVTAEPAAELARAAAFIEAAGVALAQADAEGASPRVRIRTVSRAVRAAEGGLGALRASLREARDAEARLSERLGVETGRLSGLLGGLQAIARAPEPALLLHPDGPEATARAGMILQAVTPVLAVEAAALRADLVRLTELRALQDEAHAGLEDTLARLQSARAELGRAIDARGTVTTGGARDRALQEALLGDARTLSELAPILPELSQASAPAPGFSQARGRVALPAEGELRTGFGMPDPAGVRRPGWTLDTAPGALVTAPWRATVRYAGPLLDYGNVMVLEPEAGSLMVLAGLGTLYAGIGDILDEGDPVGAMSGGSRTGLEGFVQDGKAGAEQGAKALYVEIRRDGTPVDPTEWFGPVQTARQE